MKRFFVALIMFVFVMPLGVAFADDDDGGGKKIEKVKAKIIENIGKRRSLLDNLESCVKSANSKDALKSCRKDNKKKMKALRSERKEMKEKMKEKRKKHRKEKE